MFDRASAVESTSMEEFCMSACVHGIRRAVYRDASGLELPAVLLSCITRLGSRLGRIVTAPPVSPNRLQIGPAHCTQSTPRPSYPQELPMRGVGEGIWGYP